MPQVTDNNDAPIRFGVDLLINGDAPLDKTRRYGFVTTDNAVLATDAKVTSRVGVQRAGFNLVKLFAAEHGMSGKAQDGEAVGAEIDPLTKLPVVSLYDDRKGLVSADELADIDAVLFDFPDVGARFYTRIWTLSHLLESCAQAGRPLFVLDRPNPIGGDLGAVEGPPLDEKNLSTFVGRWNIPIRHSLTIGELALLFNSEHKIGCELEVLRTEGWHRDMHWPATKLPFIAPSPNLRTYEAALVYPGTCFFEGTNLSEGRGTDQSLRQIGAPWVNGDKLAGRFNAIGVPGLRAKPVSFTPDSRKHANAKCGGVLIEITDANAARPVSAGLHLVSLVFRMYPKESRWLENNEKGFNHFDRLVGSRKIRDELINGSDAQIADRIKAWTGDTTDWPKRVHASLQYA
jgi:uncharacterized protein YbbC (DUF1343 family)